MATASGSPRHLADGADYVRPVPPIGVLLAALAIAYAGTVWVAPRLLIDHPSIDIYLARPLLWSLPAYLAFRLLGGSLDRALLIIGAVAGLVHVAIYGIGGILVGFGRSPGSVSLGHAPLQLWYLVATVSGVELTRAVLVRRWRAADSEWAFLAITVLFFVVGIAPSQFVFLRTVDEAMVIVGAEWLPALAVSGVATWMCVVGGPGASVSYRIALAAYAWFLPVLPDLGWQGELMTGVVGVVAAATFFRTIASPGREAEPAGDGVHRARTGRRWITPAAIIVALLLAVGSMGVRALTVTGVSMEPTYSRGDILLVWERANPADLEVGDVVTYHLGSLPVVHRIVDLTGDSIVTQGDNVFHPDPPVEARDIEGKVIARLPFLGRLGLMLSGR